MVVVDRMLLLRDAVNLANPTELECLPQASGMLLDERLAEDNFDLEAQLGIVHADQQEEFMSEYLYQISTIKDGITNVRQINIIATVQIKLHYYLKIFGFTQGR